MPANIDPIYTDKPDCSTNNGTGFAATLLTATAELTGVSATNLLIHTAGVNGSYVRKIRLKPLGNNVASVVRIYLNNGLDPTVATNNILYDEIGLPATTGTSSQPLVTIQFPIEDAFQAGFRLYAGLGTTVAAGWKIVTVGGQY